MSLEQKVMGQMKSAMLNKEEATLRGLRAIKAAIILAKTEKGASAELSEEAEIKLLQKLVKQRKDSMEIFKKEGREDLFQKEEDEVKVIEQFLPVQMSPDELKAALQQIIADTGASSAADLGKVMGAASKQLAGKADGKSIAAMVKELLS